MRAHTGEAWSEILDHLSQSRKIAPQLVETLLRPLHPREGTEPVLWLEAPNKFHLQYVKEKFGATLNETVRELMGSAQQWNLTVGSGNESSPAPEASASHTAAPVPHHAQTTRFADQPAARPAPPPSFLNSKYTFENFVVGKSNKFCHAAAVAVADHHGMTYNTLFIS